MIPWTVAHEATLSMAFPRQEYWSGLPLPTSGVLPDPGTESASLALQTDSLPLSHSTEPPGKPMPRAIVDINLLSPVSVKFLQMQYCGKQYMP